jgi:glycosyltransferase involved in cell wall biosynthesis
MRIGLVTGEYPPMQGGVGDFTRELGRALAALGHAVTVLTCTRAQPQSPDRVTVEPFVERWGWGAAGALARLAEARQLDVLNIQYQAAAYGMGLPIHLATWQWRTQRRPFASVVTYHDLRVPYLFPKAGGLRRRAVYLLGNRADAVIVTNDEDAAEWQAANGRAPQVVPIGSNIAAALPAGYDRAAQRARYGCAPDELLVAYFGFFNPSKGGATLVEALAQLAAQGRALRLLLVGGAHGASDPVNKTYAAEVDALLDAHGLRARTHATGFVDAPEVAAALAATDVVALPYVDGASPRRGSLLAALAHGCAIVTTAGGTFPGLANAAWLVPPGDAGTLAAGIAALADDPARRAALGADAARLAQEYGWEKIAMRTLEVYAAARQAGGRG